MRFAAWLMGAAMLSVACGSSTTAAPSVTNDDPGDDDSGTTTTVDAGTAKDASTSAKDAATSKSDSGSAAIGPDAIQVIVEPGDDGDQLLAAITAAKKSIHMTMYQMSDARFVNELIAQKKAGLDVKVVLEDFANNNEQTSGSNSSLYNTLKSGGVDVAWASATYTFTHEKCVILDDAQAWIMTMNLNTTSPKANREYLALDTQAADIAEAEAIFEADYAGQAITPTGSLLYAPGGARDQLVALIQSGKTKVDLEGEELSDYKIVDALAAAQQAGVTVHVVISTETATAAQTSAIAQLKAANVEVRSLDNPTVHAKAITADGKKAYVGSMNFTTGSLQYNRELGVITSNAASVTLVQSTIDADFAAGTAM